MRDRAKNTLKKCVDIFSDPLGSPLARPDPDRILNRQNEDLAVADFPGVRGFPDRLDHVLHGFVSDNDLQLALGDEVNYILGTPVLLLDPPLDPAALHIKDRHCAKSCGVQRGFDLFKLLGPNHCLDHLHRIHLPGEGRAFLAPMPEFIR